MNRKALFAGLLMPLILLVGTHTLKAQPAPRPAPLADTAPLATTFIPGFAINWTEFTGDPWNPVVPVYPPTPPIPDDAVVVASGMDVRPIPADGDISSWVLSEAEMTALLLSAGWEPDVIPAALVVTLCESGWSPGAFNAKDQADGLGSTGLFQLWSGHYRAHGYTYEQWSDPFVNAAVAWQVYLRNGWTVWGCKPW